MNGWEPTAERDALELRADCLARIRRFMAERDILEVETPILSSAGTTDPNIESFRLEDDDQPTRLLRTSPEFAHKRLLARQGARRCKKALVRRRSKAFVGARRRSKALDSARQRSTVEWACLNALDGARRRSQALDGS